jgi:hypothetical protein
MLRSVLIAVFVFGLGFIAAEVSSAQMQGLSNVDSKESFNCQTLRWKPHYSSDPARRDEEEEVKYRFPVRYALVYNAVNDLNIRQIEILLDSKYFSSRNLQMVLCNIKEKYPSPVHLEIEIHTSLETIETPEERELIRDSEDSRFSNLYFKYRRGSFSRFADGREAFTYTVGLSPYRERTIVLKARAVNKPQ